MLPVDKYFFKKFGQIFNNCSIERKTWAKVKLFAEMFVN